MLLHQPSRYYPSLTGDVEARWTPELSGMGGDPHSELSAHRRGQEDVIARHLGKRFTP